MMLPARTLLAKMMQSDNAVLKLEVDKKNDDSGFSSTDGRMFKLNCLLFAVSNNSCGDILLDHARARGELLTAYNHVWNAEPSP